MTKLELVKVGTFRVTKCPDCMSAMAPAARGTFICFRCGVVWGIKLPPEVEQKLINEINESQKVKDANIHDNPDDMIKKVKEEVNGDETAVSKGGDRVPTDGSGNGNPQT